MWGTTKQKEVPGKWGSEPSRERIWCHHFTIHINTKPFIQRKGKSYQQLIFLKDVLPTQINGKTINNRIKSLCKDINLEVKKMQNLYSFDDQPQT